MHSLYFTYWVRPINFNNRKISATRYLMFLKFSTNVLPAFYIKHFS